MVSNSTVTLEHGDDHTIARLSELPNSAIEAQTVEKQAPDKLSRTKNTSPSQREAGDQVNRFLLCALISASAKRIKASAEKIGEALPMPMIVRGVLRSYRLAAKDKYGPLAEPELDIAGLRILNEKVLKDEIARNSRDRVRNSETRLAHAKRLGDDTRIKAEKDGLERAIELRDRLAEEIR